MGHLNQAQGETKDNQKEKNIEGKSYQKTKKREEGKKGLINLWIKWYILVEHEGKKDFHIEEEL